MTSGAIPNNSQDAPLWSAAEALALQVRRGGQLAGAVEPLRIQALNWLNQVSWGAAPGPGQGAAVRQDGWQMCSWQERSLWFAEAGPELRLSRPEGAWTTLALRGRPQGGWVLEIDDESYWIRPDGQCWNEQQQLQQLDSLEDRVEQRPQQLTLQPAYLPVAPWQSLVQTLLEPLSTEPQVQVNRLSLRLVADGRSEVELILPVEQPQGAHPTVHAQGELRLAGVECRRDEPISEGGTGRPVYRLRTRRPLAGMGFLPCTLHIDNSEIEVSLLLDAVRLEPEPDKARARQRLEDVVERYLEGETRQIWSDDLARYGFLLGADELAERAKLIQRASALGWKTLGDHYADFQQWLTPFQHTPTWLSRFVLGPSLEGLVSAPVAERLVVLVEEVLAHWSDEPARQRLSAAQAEHPEASRCVDEFLHRFGPPPVHL